MDQAFLGCALLLLAFLAPAVVSDIRQRRIPNAVVIAGAVAGVTANAALPMLMDAQPGIPGLLGWQDSLAGWVLGLAFLLPFYAMRMIGAGDVKLLAMVGAFVGVRGVAGVALLTLFSGGVLALLMAASMGRLGRLAGNLRLSVLTASSRVAAGQFPDARDLTVSVGTLPYAVAIAVGTVAYLFYCFGALLTSAPG